MFIYANAQLKLHKTYFNMCLTACTWQPQWHSHNCSLVSFFFSLFDCSYSHDLSNHLLFSISHTSGKCLSHHQQITLFRISCNQIPAPFLFPLPFNLCFVAPILLTCFLQTHTTPNESENIWSIKNNFGCAIVLWYFYFFLP